MNGDDEPPHPTDAVDAVDAMDSVLARLNGSAPFGARPSPPLGPRGFGHSHDRSEVVEAEAAAIRDAALRVLAGEALSSVVREWNARGIRTTRGRLWRVNSLSALLIQPRLAGLRPAEGGRYVPAWPAILEESVHHRLVVLRSSRGHARRPPRRSLLMGRLRCGRCGGTLHFLHRPAGDYYRCPASAAGGCSGVLVKADLVEEHVRDLVVMRLDSSEFQASMHDVMTAPDRQVVLHQLAHDIQMHRHQLKELAGLWAERSITKEEWHHARRSVARDLGRLEARLQRREAVQAVVTFAGQGQVLDARWAGLSVEDRQAVIGALLDRVVVEPVGRHRGVPASQRFRSYWREGEARSESDDGASAS